MSTEPVAVDVPRAEQQLAPADVVVAVTACVTDDAVARAREAVRAACAGLPAAQRALLVHAGAAGPVDDATGSDDVVQVCDCRMATIGRLPFSGAEARDLFQPLSAIAARVGARACVLIGAQPDGVTPEAVRALLVPVVDRQIDLVLPQYPRHKFEGLLNTGIVNPLTRALYGHRVEGQLGVDFGFSARCLAALAERPAGAAAARPLWLLTVATARGLRVGQARLDRWLPPVEQTTDVSTALAQVTGSLFEDMEHHAATWQRARGSQPVPVFGRPGPPPDEPREAPVADMLESFRIGARNLQDVWARVLSPGTMVELNRLTRLADADFRMPDDLWARLLFDFALGHRLRLISRDHLLRAMTPLYLGWVASFVQEMAAADGHGVRDRVERLCVAFESAKPSLVARWRWPDRFNP
jgi:hypothetical protein